MATKKIDPKQTAKTEKKADKTRETDRKATRKTQAFKWG